jgi:hypothetical protein
MLRRKAAKIDDVEGRMGILFELTGRKKSAIAERNNEMRYAMQPFGAYTNAAAAGAFNPAYPGAQNMQLTGPPPRKRKHIASGDAQQSAYAVKNARYERRNQRTAHPAGGDQAAAPRYTQDAQTTGSTEVAPVPENSISSKIPAKGKAAAVVDEVTSIEKST